MFEVVWEDDAKVYSLYNTDFLKHGDLDMDLNGSTPKVVDKYLL